MSENELRPCPFCGNEPQEITTNGKPLVVCWCRGCVNDPKNWNTRPIEDALNARIAELEAERDQAKAIVSRLRDFLFDYTQFHISTNPEERWWALVDKFDELVKEREE